MAHECETMAHECETSILKHTPGPWLVRDVAQPNMVQVVVHIGREVYSICDLWGSVEGNSEDDITDEQIANAHLIAAAPKLLEVLERVLERICKQAKTLHRETGHEDQELKLLQVRFDLCALIPTMRAAIRKAKGGYKLIRAVSD